MLTAHQQRHFIGLQTFDGYTTALYNAASGSTMAVTLGPVPEWATVCDWCGGEGIRSSQLRVNDAVLDGEEECGWCGGGGVEAWKRQEAA